MEGGKEEDDKETENGVGSGENLCVGEKKKVWNRSNDG